MIPATSTSWFGARTVVAVSAALVIVLALAAGGQAQDANGCRVECYPNTKMINSKGGVGKGDNCRWILRTDGKAARLCDHVKCKKVCPSNQAQQQQVDQQGAASDNLRIEQQTEAESPASATENAGGASMGIMRHLHGGKMGKAPVPGVAGGRLAGPAPQAPAPSGGASSGGRRVAPTLPPAVQYDENDTPPPISRFLDISPEE